MTVPTETPSAKPILDLDEWSLSTSTFDPERVGHFETLFALGNGVWVCRGAAMEACQVAPHYPGTYRGGFYDRRIDWVLGNRLEHEDLVNLPNWLFLVWRTPGEAWFERSSAHLLEYEQRLDLHNGVLSTRLRYRDSNGNTTLVTERRLVHMGSPHLAASEVTFEAEDWSGQLEVRSGIDGRVQNANVEEYEGTAGEYLEEMTTVHANRETISLNAKTRGNRRGVAIAVRTRGLVDGAEPTNLGRESRLIFVDGTIHVAPGERAVVEKCVALFTTLDRAIDEPVEAARRELEHAPDFGELLRSHQQHWHRLWQRFDVAVLGYARLTGVLRFHLFQLLQTISEHSANLDAGIPGRGWHGEGYRGHIFWDELFVFPLIVTRVPELARSLLLYRYHRLPEARRAAAVAGYQGAMFPWRSATDGREVTDPWRKNPKSGRWIPDHSCLQRHIGAAVCLNVWRYFEVTADQEFLERFGAELILDTARFWSSIARWDAGRDRYVIEGVVGPDEFHEAYPESVRPGINNNAYTNLMAVWNIERALDVLSLLSAESCAHLRNTLAITDAVLDKWRHITERMYVPYEDGIIWQFEGFRNLKPFEWELYRARYGDIHRLDDILEAEGDQVSRYQATKQADVLMLFYLLPVGEVARLITRLGYRLEGDLLHDNLDYYLGRTSHGSTLSRVVHAAVLARSERGNSWPLLQEALGSDLEDIQGGTTKAGLHLGAMAGTVDIFHRCYLGMEFRSGELWLDPLLPEELQGIELRVRVRQVWIHVILKRPRLTLRVQADAKHPVVCRFRGAPLELQAGAEHTILLERTTQTQ